ncbi:MAG: PAS domain-containing protein [Isosphaeraceae bacterium]
MRIAWVDRGGAEAEGEPSPWALGLEAFPDGESALQAADCRDEPRLDCAVVAWSLPDMTAVEFLKRVADQWGAPKLPVILLLDDRAQLPEALDALGKGAQDYLFREGLTPAALEEAAGKAVARFKGCEDVHSRRALLEWKNRRLKSLIEQLPDVVSVIDRDRRYRYVNAAVARASGHPPEHYIGKTSLECSLGDELGALWDTKVAEVLGTGLETVFEFSCRGPEVSEPMRWYQVRLVPDGVSSGLPEAVLAVTTDVTRIKEANEALKRGQELLRRVIDGILAMVGVLTPDGVLVEANRPALVIAGLRPEDVLGKPFEQTYWWSYSPEIQERLRETMRRARAGETLRLRRRRPDRPE